jgi:tRNA (guanine37-N1)-methyltransferase
MADKIPRSLGSKSIRVSAKPRDLMDERANAPGVWEARVITLFPDAFPGVLGHSLTGRALQEGKWRLATYDLRKHGIGRHRNVDDTPAGGGAGMVLRPDVVGAAVEEASAGRRGHWWNVYVSPRGRPFTQSLAQEMTRLDGAMFLSGRFEGVDQRALDHHGMIEISLGDFVMTGGELAVQAMIDATVRLLPGVLGNAESTEEESFSNGLLEHPQYTRPAEWQGKTIPDVLLSGNHGEIAKWRRARSEALTEAVRPDLWDKAKTKLD